MLSTLIEKRPTSETIHKKSCEYIPQGVNSPVRAFPGMKEAPLIAKRGLGDEVIDADGNTFIDFCCSWGAAILGHADPEIVQTASQRIAWGSTFGLATEIEGKVAQAITELIPSIEKIRFVSSGTEATMSAARLARGYTGKDLIIKFVGCYHGHADLFLVQAGSGVIGFNSSASSAGVPDAAVKDTLCIPFNDCEAVRATFANPEYKDRIAAVIIEPIAGNMGTIPSTPEFLQLLREETEKAGALLIFDEVISGFRAGGIKGAQGYYKIAPDLTCLGKIIGGGFPAAAFGGRADIMNHLSPEGKVYQAGTLSGNPVAMEAAYCTLQRLQQPGFYEELDEKTRLITDPVKRYIEEHSLNACLQRVGSMFTLFLGKKEVRCLADTQACQGYPELFSFLFERGIYFSPLQYEACFVSSAHTEDHLLYTRDCLIEFLCTKRG